MPPAEMEKLASASACVGESMTAGVVVQEKGQGREK